MARCMRYLALPVLGAMVLSIALATSAWAQVIEIQIVPDEEVYNLGDTAIFAITILKDGAPLSGASTKITATFPNELTEVTLQQVQPGVFAFQSQLTAVGQKTLTVSVNHDYAAAIAAMEAKIAALDEEIAALQAALEGASQQQAAVIQMKIVNRQQMKVMFEEKIATLSAPLQSEVSSITVQGPNPIQFGARWPEVNNCGGRWTNDPREPIAIEVSDSVSVVVAVDLYINGAAEPIAMTDNGTRWEYFTTVDWTIGLRALTFVATDAAGNSNTTEFSFILDLTPPVVSAEIVGFPPVLRLVMTDDGGIRWTTGISVKIGTTVLPPMSMAVTDGGIAVTAEYSLPAGATINVSVEDWAGNTVTMIVIN